MGLENGHGSYGRKRSASYKRFFHLKKLTFCSLKKMMVERLFYLTFSFEMCFFFFKGYMYMLDKFSGR